MLSHFVLWLLFQEVQQNLTAFSAVAVVVGDRCMRECSLRRLPALETAAVQREFPVALVEEGQRSAAANDKKVLHAFVLKVGEKRTSGTVQDAYPGFSVTSSKVLSQDFHAVS